MTTLNTLPLEGLSSMEIRGAIADLESEAWKHGGKPAKVTLTVDGREFSSLSAVLIDGEYRLEITTKGELYVDHGSEEQAG